MIAHIPLAHGAGHQAPDTIIVHAMAEFIQVGIRAYSTVDFLDMKGLSAHALISPSGTVVRCRNDDQGAYHAKGHNRNSLGIEFIVPGVHTYETFKEAIRKPYISHAQWRAGIATVKDWIATHDIQSVVRHSDIDPQRKIDPGEGFTWDFFLDEIDDA